MSSVGGTRRPGAVGSAISRPDRRFFEARLACNERDSPESARGRAPALVSSRCFCTIAASADEPSSCASGNGSCKHPWRCAYGCVRVASRILRRRRGETFAEPRRAQRHGRARHDRVALYRHAGRPSRDQAAVQPEQRSLRPLRRAAGRLYHPIGRRGAARLARGDVVVGGGERHQFALDRHRDRQSRP